MDAGDKARQRVAKVEAIGKLIDEYHLKVQGRLPHPRDSLAQACQDTRSSDWRRAAAGYIWRNGRWYRDERYETEWRHDAAGHTWTEGRRQVPDRESFKRRAPPYGQWGSWEAPTGSSNSSGGARPNRRPISVPQSLAGFSDDRSFNLRKAESTATDARSSVEVSVSAIAPARSSIEVLLYSRDGRARSLPAVQALARQLGVAPNSELWQQFEAHFQHIRVKAASLVRGGRSVP